MAKRSTKEPMWNDIISEESLARMRLEAVPGVEGRVSGYRLVFPASDPRGKSTEVRFATPKLHVSGGETFLHGKLFNKTESPFKRWLCIKTSKEFGKNQAWLDKDENRGVEEENEEYYQMVEALSARVRELVWEAEPVRNRFLKEAILEVRKDEIAETLMGLDEKRQISTVSILKTKTDLLNKAVRDLNINKVQDTKWRDTAALHLSKQKSITTDPKFLKVLKKKMMENYKDAALNRMVANPVYAEDDTILESAHEKIGDEFGSWVFRGREADGEGGEELKSDDPPHGTHRYKMRPFYQPRKSNTAPGDARTLDWANTTRVDVHPKAAERLGLDGKEVFRLEEDARQQGYVVRRMKIISKFESVRKNRLPDGTTVPWYEDPRQEMLRPGSIVRLIVSFFIYVEPRIGVRMHFDQFVRLYERGPEYGREAPEMDMDEVTVVGGGGGSDEAGGEGVDDDGPKVLNPTSIHKRKRGADATEGDEEDPEAIQGGEGDEKFD